MNHNNKKEIINAPSGAIILAGGDSKRLGQPKALLDFFGQPLIALMVRRLQKSFTEITIVSDRPELFSALPVKLTDDLIKGKDKSPLRGIHSGLSFSDLPYQFVVACDMPLLNLELIEYMRRYAAHYDAVVPHIGSYFQPLHAFYNRSCLEPIAEHLKEERYKVTSFYEKIKIRYVGADLINRFDPLQKSFININTWDDYQKTLGLLSDQEEIG